MANTATAIPRTAPVPNTGKSVDKTALNATDTATTTAADSAAAKQALAANAASDKPATQPVAANNGIGDKSVTKGFTLGTQTDGGKNTPPPGDVKESASQANANTRDASTSVASASSDVSASKDAQASQNTLNALAAQVAAAQQPASQSDATASIAAAAAAAAAITTATPQAATASAAVNPALAISAPVGSPSWASELSNKVVFMTNDHQQTAQLSLNPPNLGPLQVVLQVSGSNAHAMFVSQHQHVRDAVEQALPKLREQLAAGGMGLGSASVSDGAAQQQAGNQNGGNGSRRSNTAQNEATVATLASSVAATPGRTTQGLVDTFV